MSPAAVWTLMALAGAAAALYGMLDARRSVLALAKDPNGMRRLAQGSMRAELIRFLIHSSWAVVGYLALERSTPDDWSLGAAVLVIGLGGLFVSSVLDAFDRAAVRDD